MLYISLKTKAQVGNVKNAKDTIGNNTLHIHAQTVEHTKEMNNEKLNEIIDNYNVPKMRYHHIFR